MQQVSCGHVPFYWASDEPQPGGWVLNRERVGSATYWNAWQEDAQGRTIPGTAGRNLGSRAKALAFIKERMA